MELNKQIKELNRLKRRIEVNLLSDINTDDRIVLSHEYIHIIDLLNTIDKNATHEIQPFIYMKYYAFKHNMPFNILFQEADFINKTSSDVIKKYKNFTLNPNKIFMQDNRVELNTKQKIHILKSFVESIDKELLPFFEQLQNFIIYHKCNNKTYGRTFSFVKHDKYYIYLNSNYRVSSLTDAYTLAHEIGHAYEDKYVLEKPIHSISKYDNYYSEVCSTFFDTVFLNYVLSHFHLKEANSLKEYKLNEILSCFKTLNFLLNNVNILYEDYNYRIPYYELLSKQDKIHIAECSSYLKSIKYGYGILIGTYFANLYQKNKEEGLKQLKEFLNKQCYTSCDGLYHEFIKDYIFLEEELDKIKRIK